MVFSGGNSGVMCTTKIYRFVESFMKELFQLQVENCAFLPDGHSGNDVRFKRFCHYTTHLHTHTKQLYVYEIYLRVLIRVLKYVEKPYRYMSIQYHNPALRHYDQYPVLRVGYCIMTKFYVLNDSNPPESVITSTWSNLNMSIAQVKGTRRK